MDNTQMDSQKIIIYNTDDDKNHNVTYRTSTSRCGRYGRIKTVRNKNK